MYNFTPASSIPKEHLNNNFIQQQNSNIQMNPQTIHKLSNNPNYNLHVASSPNLANSITPSTTPLSISSQDYSLQHSLSQMNFRNSSSMMDLNQFQPDPNNPHNAFNPISLSSSSQNSMTNLNSYNSNNQQQSLAKDNKNIPSDTMKNSNSKNFNNHNTNHQNRNHQNNKYNNNNHNQHQNRNNHNNNIQQSQNHNTVGPDSPWFQKVCAFEDCVSQTLYMSQTPRRKNIRHRSEHPNSNSNPLFWDSIGRAMGLYHDLINTPELNSDRVSKLVHLLHNGLRANRNQLTRMNKKPDYDSQSFHKEMTNYLCKSLREISKDVLNAKVQLNEYGAMHLITAFKELLLFQEAVDIWKNAINDTNKYTTNIFLNPRVVGVILPILYDNGVSYPEIQTLYEKSSSMINYFHPNLSVGMIRASLSAGQNDMALKLFQKLCEESTEMKYGYLIETHLSFIGECKDLNVAQTFFDKALNDEMPYKIDLQVSYVKSFLKNIWNNTHNFHHVYEIWYKSSVHYGRDVNHGISSSLNDTFFDVFFENYSNDKVQGFHALQTMIQTYNTIKPIDEPFFNIILAKCTIWRDRAIIDFIDEGYELFNIPKTIVAYRILLKSMGSVDDASNGEILQRWVDLITKSDEIGQRFIANADWAALRDATVTWTQFNRDKDNKNSMSPTRNSPSPTSSPISSTDGSVLFSRTTSASSVSNDELDFSHPAFAAANASGAFDDIGNDESKDKKLVTTTTHQTTFPSSHNERMILYLKIVKRYSAFCRDSRQLTRLTSGTALKYSVLQEALKEFPTLNISDIPIPALHNLKPTCL
ncbi:hypothetical protein TBLA_0A01780 [Henningerozyma blattae CBS 6284]|uniref:Protein RMD9-like, mitochondrial n=1 Tax=Henningerozyma blattae (strain ATCC 34711 / CBS 6284 / DSM 70876 / NBRC 10599 / NRRL Y-10934 / UCD 77-7) TaxID=1071380 RepID=I2GV26_HENB6|nr:hypothetical protein TBLA_0A01780 [Tetrapisispora blattae CBS 6284]CCH57978.1 hypothetical protein TBLA_0A01780 [Tetrapisispora blattae CBS 6284]